MSWFRPKTHGYGASPANWKGWAVTLGFVVIETALTFVMFVRPIIQGALTAMTVVLWMLASLALVVGFIAFVRARTDGEWRWRWGEGDK